MYYTALAMLAAGVLPAQAPAARNLDFHTGTLAGWVGDGFYLTAGTSKGPGTTWGVCSSDAGKPGRQGLLRYIFLGAGRLRPALAAPLPPSFRRKGICVAGIAVLLTALAPLLAPGPAGLLCLAGLGLLCYSFGADAALLLARGRRGEAAITT